MVASSPSPLAVQHADRHDRRAVGQSGEADRVVGGLRDDPGDEGPVAVAVQRVLVVGHEVERRDEVGPAEVGRAVELPPVAKGDSRVQHGHDDALTAGAAVPEQVGPGFGRVDAGAREHVPLHLLPAVGAVGAAAVVGVELAGQLGLRGLGGAPRDEPPARCGDVVGHRIGHAALPSQPRDGR